MLGEGGQFRKDARPEIMQAMDRRSGLLDLSLQTAGDLAHPRPGRREWQRGVRLLDPGQARHGLALGVVGGALGEVRLLLVLSAFGLAPGDGQGQRPARQEALEIGSVRAGGIDADGEGGLGMLLVQPFEALAEILLTLLIVQDGERLGGCLPVGAPERDAVALACGVDADADAGPWVGRGHAKVSRGEEQRRLGGNAAP